VIRPGWLFACLLLLTCATAQAKDTLPWKPDPPGTWRKMTQQDETSSSKCIGKTTTPICAVETLEACLARRNWDFCKLVYHGPELFQPYIPQAASIYELYAISKVTRLHDSDHPPWEFVFYNPIPHNWKPGDLKVKLLHRECWGEECQPSPWTTTLQLRALPDGSWIVIGWDGYWK